MSQSNHTTLIVIYGPTGIGKTQVAIKLAQMVGCDIISADSRQLYKGMRIGTAAPNEEELSQVPHHFVGHLALGDYYNASMYEQEVCAKLEQLFTKNPTQVLTGGSMLYVDAITKGIDYIPDVDPEIRQSLKTRLAEQGIEGLRIELKTLDPVYYRQADLKNPIRIVHALEVCLTTGKPYSSFRSEQAKQRPFRIIKIGLQRDRQDLYQRINQRVHQMIATGLVEEVRSLLPYRHLHSLHTVGYQEMFAYLDGTYSLDRAIELIQRNSRHYAKKQITWYKKDPEIQWFHPDQMDSILNYYKQNTPAY